MECEVDSAPQLVLRLFPTNPDDWDARDTPGAARAASLSTAPKQGTT